MVPEVPVVDPLVVAGFAGDPDRSSFELEPAQWFAIERLIFAYSYNWDSRQPGATAELFTSDAELGFFLNGAAQPTNRTLGRDRILEEMAARANVLKRWRIEQLPDHPEPRAVRTGYYKSWCVETPSGWRFQKRETHLSGVFHPKEIYPDHRSDAAHRR